MFEKNLEAIDNMSLKRRLSRITPIESRVGISYCVTPTNDYVLLKNELPADDLNNPREAIRKFCDENIKQEMKSNDIIIGFGLGLGYILDELYNKYPSKIFIYEPDLMLLHFVLSNVEMSEFLASGRVYITNDLDELIAKLSQTFITKDKVEIVYLQNYAVVKNKELLMLTQKVFDTCKSKMVDVNTITKFSKKWLINSIENVTKINEGTAYKLSDLDNKFVGQTALIAAAGPSLNDNIEKLRANRNKFVLFAVNKAVKYLLDNGITPDFVVCLDAGNMKKTISGFGENLKNSCCIMDIRTDKNVMAVPFKKFFVNFSDTDFFMKKLLRFNDFMKFNEAGGSASTLALVAAAKMGFSKIVFAGLDLAFKDNVIYTSGETMNRISQEEILVDKVKKNIVRVRSVNGDYVYTREDYEAFIQHFSTIIKELNYNEIYNLSTFGAYIHGVKSAHIEQVLPHVPASMTAVSFVSPFKFELNDFMQEEFCNINNIISLISKDVFSPALVNAVVKSVLVYQYLQADVLNVLQRNFEPELAQEFIGKTKLAIKEIVSLLQNNRLI